VVCSSPANRLEVAAVILQPLETKHDGRAATYPQEGVSLQPVALPRPDDGPTGEPASQLLLSIVVPLGDSRTHPIQNMTCWTEAQTRRGREYQVIAVSDGTDLAMEAAIADVLRPHDKLLRCSPDEHVLARLARGAHCADAGLLFFAEHHCIPEATCVDATIRFFERRPEVAIGVLTMKQRHGAADGGLHERWFASVEEDWARSADWIRIRTGAFAMRKHAYFALGAHDGRYGLFADEILGAKAHHAGLVSIESPKAQSTILLQR
jgi:hypothetical protein